MPRTAHRLGVLARAALGAMRGLRPRLRPAQPAKILVLHELLLGDTLMLAPLLAALRLRFPQAALFVTAKPEIAPLFAARPYGAQVLPYAERMAGAWAALAPARGADLVLLPGENRYVLQARALGARWVVAFAGARPAWKDSLCDELLALPARPTALADMFALLSGVEEAQLRGLRHSPADWPAPPAADYDAPGAPYAVLHVGAGSPLRLWEDGKWRELAQALEQRGIAPVWSAGPGEAQLVAGIDPQGRHRSYAGALDLAQLWRLLSGAEMLVTLDTGVAHLAKLAGVPTAALFGPGSARLFGRGAFWRDSAYAEVTVADFPCRDQRHLFKRELEWVRRCNRGPAECPAARCMQGISVAQVLAALPARGRSAPLL